MTAARHVRHQILITGGGTAGHVEPALAVANALVAAGIDRRELLFVGAKRGMEATLVPDAGFDLRLLPGRGLLRRLAFRNVISLLQLSLAFFQALLIVGRIRPAVVVMVGGYAGLACSLAAVLFGVPVVVVNVDASAGKANRVIGRFAAYSAVAGPASGLPRAVVTGAPLREAVLQAEHSSAGRREAAAALGVEEDRRVVAVVGGSLGAGTLNAIALYLRTHLDVGERVLIYHVTGARNAAGVQAAVDSSPIGDTSNRYRLVAYEKNLPALFALADLVITRAGAMTVAELASIGSPSILVPLPGAPGDHQSENARALIECGAAIVVPDEEATGERIEVLVAALLHDEGRLESMSAAARTVGRREAASMIADLVIDSARPRREARIPGATQEER